MMGEGATDVQLSHKNAGQPIHMFKILMVGGPDVGKTSFLRRCFGENDRATIGVDFAIKTFKTAHGDLVKLQAWDTAGQEKFHTITSAYYRGAKGILLMYDVTNRHTFDQLPYWMEDIEKNATDDTLVVLVANITNAGEVDRQVSPEEGRKFADERNIMFFEASEKNNANVINIFQKLSEQLLSRHNKQGSSAPGAVASTTKGPVKESNEKTENVKLCVDKRGEQEKKEKKCDLL